MNENRGKFRSLPGRYDYVISVLTGDRRKRASATTVDCILKADGEDLIKIKLDIQFSDDFKPSQTDKFVLKNQPFPSVDSLEIMLDPSEDDHHDWYIETIQIHNKTTKSRAIFPIQRWIRQNFVYTFSPVITCLPQHDERKDQRHDALQEKRKIYELEQKARGITPQVKHLPMAEKYPFLSKWSFTLFAVAVILESKFLSLVTRPLQCIEDTKNMYTKRRLTEPSNITRWDDDVAFGLQRIAGVNNSFIRLCKQIPDKLGVTNEMLELFLEGLSLPLALNNRRIFIVDHSILKDCPTGPKVVVAAPIALFFQRNDGCLVPIAIQLQQDKADDNPVFLPSDPKYTWIMAKLWFNNADACLHQAIAHFGFTHILMEGVAVLCHRYLSECHPLFKLMAPHFVYLMAINATGLKTLLIPGGWADKELSVATTGIFELMRRQLLRWRMSVEGTLPEDLKSRGVDDMNVLPHYHFRNDAMLLYDCIRNYVTEYVSIYYVTDDDIIQDDELRDWRTEMVRSTDDGGLGILGVAGENGQFTKREHVVEVVTSVIFTCTVAHSATNFKQYDEYAYPLNYPAKLTGRPPISKCPLNERDLIDILPDKPRMLSVMTMAKILDSNTTKPLGYFDVNYIYDPKGLKVVENFRASLKTVSHMIQERNKTRDPQYTTLDPCEVSNSITI